MIVLVERGGAARSMPVEHVDAKTLRRALKECVDKSATIMTDELAPYRIATVGYAAHRRVNHGKGEYARGEAHINTAESFFCLLKLGVYGVFHHVSKKHLHRYCDEFDFRWNVRPLKDAARREITIQQARGKRLMYKSPVNPPTEPPHDGAQLPFWPAYGPEKPAPVEPKSTAFTGFATAAI